MTDQPDAPSRSARNMRRRAAPVDAETAPVETEGAQPPAPRAVAAPPAPAPRDPTDFDGLQNIAHMDRADVDALMAQFVPKANGGRVRPGDRVEANVTRIASGSVFLDIGGKADAALDRQELPEDVAIGDRIVAWVHSFKDGEIRLTRTPSGEAARDMLREAQAAREPVSGKVVSANDHGVEVELGEGVRAFCPLSQLGADVDPASLVGTTTQFRVTDTRGRDVIVSRRAILEEEARAGDVEKLRGLREGDVVEGTVSSLREFGAFVKLEGGIEGLVHISNLSHTRVKDPAEVVKEGQIVKVRVLSVDLDRRRVNLGIRQAEDAPVHRATAQATGRGFNVFADLLSGVKPRK